MSNRTISATCAATVAFLLGAATAHAGRGWIEDPTGRVFLQVAFRSTPTYQDLAETQAALTRMAAILCDATEGQLQIARIRLLGSPASGDLAALWVHDLDAASGGPYDRGGADLHRLGAHMDVFSSAVDRPDRLAHLLAHHAFGLGDQYDDQRRRGGACGIGPGFEPGRPDEKNHSIMQGAGSMRCLEGQLGGQECTRDDQCGGVPCRAVLASEFSLAANHDLLRGDGDVCPQPSPASRVRLTGLLPAKGGVLQPLDGTEFLSARASSEWHEKLELLGPAGTLPGVALHVYLAHPARLEWQLAVAADASQFGGERGKFLLLRSWTLKFNEDFSLSSVQPEDLRLQLPASGGKGPAEVALDVGTRNPDSHRNPGQGYDGLQMVRAGKPAVEVSVDGVVNCPAPWCAASWNQSTGRWELSEQSLLHGGASDWQTLTTNLRFLRMPAQGVAADAPAMCDTPPQFVTDVMGLDQVVLVLDTSRSMGLRVDGRSGEVCGNGIDDDLDGRSDEHDCADSRLEYERTAVRAFLAIAEDRSLQVGLVSMHTDAEILTGVDEVGGPRRAVMGAVLGALRAAGDTALGTALERAQDALKKVERLARSRSVILMTDGAHNVGVAPGQEARKLDSLMFRVFTVGIASAADQMTLSAIAARNGGVSFHAARANGTPAILAEIAARHSGSALLIARTPFELARSGDGLPASRDFEFSVEEKSGELVVFLGTRNDRIDDWRVLFELVSPDGERIDDTALRSHAERGFVVAKVADPKPGRWILRVLAAGHGIQRNEILAYSRHPNAGFFVDADPRLATVRRAVRISARPAFVSDIAGDVSIAGSIRRPDGSEVPIELSRDPLTQSWGADFDDFSGRGPYEVRLRLRVGAHSQPALGEPIFPGPPRVLIRVPPFERTATASFFVADGGPPPCQAEDCDDDGLADRLETGCPEDGDGDGMPNQSDADSDNDEILDGEEGVADLDGDGVPDFCDAETTPDSLGAAIEAEEAALATACGAEAATSRERLKASLSAVRRILQALRHDEGLPTDLREDAVRKLDQVIEYKKQAEVIGDVLPEFCGKYQSRLEEALLIERQLRVRVDPYLTGSPR